MKKNDVLQLLESIQGIIYRFTNSLKTVVHSSKHKFKQQEIRRNLRAWAKWLTQLKWTTVTIASSNKLRIESSLSPDTPDTRLVDDNFINGQPTSYKYEITT